MKKVLQVLLHLLGFPLLIAMVAIVSIPMLRDGSSYGIFVFVGLLFTVVMAIVYYIVFICMVKSKKKSKTKQTMILIVTCFVLLCGLWIVLDFALPDFLANATSNTIFYEDLVDNYEARNLVNKALLDEYITRNFNVGNLPDENHGGKTLEQYKKEGYKNQLVKKLMEIQFASIDGDGYATYKNPWIGMATADRLTVPALIHLLLDERELQNKGYYLYDEATGQVNEEHVDWNILDMLGTDMDLDINIEEMIGGLAAEEPLVGTLLKLVSFEDLIGSLSGKVAVIVQELLGSPIYVSYHDAKITLTPSNESRGVLDYQSMAWLNSNGLLYAVVTLLATRYLFFIFAPWLILINFMIGMLRGMGKERGKIGKVQAGRKNPPMMQPPQQQQMFMPPMQPQPYTTFQPMPYPYGFVMRQPGQGQQ